VYIYFNIKINLDVSEKIFKNSNLQHTFFDDIINNNKIESRKFMNILDIFYNSIIKEAQEGRINSYGKSNIIFSTIIEEDNLYYKAVSEDKNLIIPTLVIKDKNRFNNLLIEYVEKAKIFYEDINDLENLYEINENDNKEKFIMTRIWSNATFEDFQNPIDFLSNRIAFFENKFKFSNLTGYSDMFKSNVIVNLEKDIIDNETPYKLKIKLIDENNNEVNLPTVKLAIANNKAYIYAIQREQKDYKSNEFGKKVNRILYKSNDGFDSSTDNYDIYGSGNLKDVSSSFLMSANICLSILEKNGIEEIVIPSILIQRYNSRNIKYNIQKNKQIKNQKEAIDIINDKYQNDIESNDKLQENLTEKLIRTFLRLGHHHTNIEISSYPTEVDTSLHIKFNGEIDVCNNRLFEETYNLEDNKNRFK